MPIRQWRGCLANLLGLLILGVVVFYGVAAITNPWAFHIGGRPTPLLYWSGSGKLVTKGGTYPVYITLFPSPHFSTLHLDGLRPTGGVQGSGWLCTPRGKPQYLKLSGTIYGGWRSTEGSVMSFRLLEQKIFDVGQQQGYFDLYGRWHGQELVMDDRGRSSGTFRSGLKIEHASVTFDWGRYWSFRNVCATAWNVAAHQ
jgi:hypothetical protein